MHPVENRIEPTLLRRINERRLLEVIQQQGPSSRASLTRASGMTAPTVSKAVESLLKRGLVEEMEPIDQILGRPGRLLCMAARSAAVIGVVIESDRCCLVSSGLDGRFLESQTRRCVTPSSYDALLDVIEFHCRDLIGVLQGTVQGIGISVPGLVNERLREITVSPNLHLLDKRNPARDLEKRLSIQCLLFQETEALCLSEQLYGEARGRPDFAMLDVSTGLGLGVMSGGRLLTGHSGLAGELGHITIDPNGIECGCGNRGCLETLATDAALARLISEKLGRSIGIDEALEIIQSGRVDVDDEIKKVSQYLSIAIAAVINIFNPTTLFVYGGLLSSSPETLQNVVTQVEQRALAPSMADCRIVVARGSKRQGAIAGMIHHLTHAWAPSIR